MLEDVVCFRYPHLFKLAQSVTGVLILICLGSASGPDSNGVLWFITLVSVVVSVIATVLFLLDRSDVVYTLSNGSLSWNLVEFIYSSVLGLLNLLGVWLAFSYAGQVQTGGQTTAYVIAGLFLVAQTSFYTAPALMLYEKINAAPRQTFESSHSSDPVETAYQNPSRIV